MGADLMIRPLFTRNYRKYEPAFKEWVHTRDILLLRGDVKGADVAQTQMATYLDKMYARGYFRDGYNSRCLLTPFGLRWGSDVASVLTNKKGKMRWRQARRFLWLLANKEADLELNLRQMKAGKGETRADVARYFHGKYAQLKGFLQEAIDRRAVVTCSL